jgi:hypothetical protein
MHVMMESLMHLKTQFDKGAEAFEGKVFGPNDPLPEFPEITKYPLEENKARWLNDPPPEVLRQIEEAKETDWDRQIRAAAEELQRARMIRPTTWAEWAQ